MNNSIIFEPERSISCSSYAVPLGVVACGSAAFLAVWGGQTERETPLADFKFHAARVRVCVGLAALVRVSYGVGGQPVLEVGVVGLDFNDEKSRIVPMLPNFFEIF